MLPADGASAALGADGALGADPELLERLVARRRRSRRRSSPRDLFYDPRDGTADGWRERGAAVVEMEAATMLQVAAPPRRRGGVRARR